MQLGQQFLQYMACYLLRMGQDLVMSYRYKTISLGLCLMLTQISLFFPDRTYFYSVFSAVCTTAFPCANTCNKRKSVSLKDATSIKEVVTVGRRRPLPPHTKTSRYIHHNDVSRTRYFTKIFLTRQVDIDRSLGVYLSFRNLTTGK